MNIPSITEKNLWSVTANNFTVHADSFAYRVDEYQSHLYMLSMQGPQEAVKAIFAALVKQPPESVHLLEGLDGKYAKGYKTLKIPSSTIGTWSSSIKRLPISGTWHMLCYTKLCEFNNDDPNFVLLIRPGQNIAELYRKFLDHRVDIPLHPSWTDWLWKRAQRRQHPELMKLESNNIDAYLVNIEPDALASEIRSAIQSGALTVPDDQENQ